MHWFNYEHLERQNNNTSGRTRVSNSIMSHGISWHLATVWPLWCRGGRRLHVMHPSRTGGGCDKESLCTGFCRCQLCLFLEMKTFQLSTHSPASSQMDYSNTVYMVLSLNSTKKLQVIGSAVAQTKWVWVFRLSLSFVILFSCKSFVSHQC